MFKTSEHSFTSHCDPQSVLNRFCCSKFVRTKRTREAALVQSAYFFRAQDDLRENTRYTFKKKLCNLCLFLFNFVRIRPPHSLKGRRIRKPLEGFTPNLIDKLSGQRDARARAFFVTRFDEERSVN